MAQPHPVDGAFDAYARSYRAAAARLLGAAQEGSVDRDAMVRWMVSSWRKHVELCLENLLVMGGMAMDDRWRRRPASASIDALWTSARRLLLDVGGRPEEEVEAAVRAVRQLSGPPDGDGQPPPPEEIPGGWRLAEMHAAMAFLSELLEREARRLRRIGERRMQALTWMV
jgi:hypothetical protein